ncbi:MAG: hypothetical protein LBT39_02930, partial [Treponema sp.]|nr:hypothetical protein [Treponema sp.]
MVKSSRFFVFAAVLCLLPVCLFAQVGPQALEPQSMGDLDGETTKLASQINQRLSALAGGTESVTIIVGSFPREGNTTALGNFWSLDLSGELSNILDRRFAIITGGGTVRANYEIAGELVDALNTI